MDYICEKENQKYIDDNNIKSKCCNAIILANSGDEWFCTNCGNNIKGQYKNI